MGLLVAAFLSSGAYTVSPAYSGDSDLAAYQAATPCTNTSGPADNCYLPLPVTVIAFRWGQSIKGRSKEYITVSSKSHGVAELVFDAGAPVAGLNIGMPGSVRIYHGKPVALDLDSRTLLTSDNPLVIGSSKPIGLAFLLLGLVLLLLLLVRIGVFSSGSTATWRRLTVPQWLVSVGIPLAFGLFLTYRLFR
ncbi:MAG TPA: hypothetical protein VLS53_03370 [Candidatus Dormibacteraeota bacterium]|nr:hypothetical protein [Candidatus Dormibacteraeota bacterium]